MCGGRNMETYVVMCRIGGGPEFSLWLGKLKRALYQPGRVDGEGVGREVQKGGNMCILMAD